MRIVNRMMRLYLLASIGVLVVASNAPDQCKNVCMSEQCIAASHVMFQTMNKAADPCEDFNEFACGGFIKNIKIPEHESNVDTWTSLKPEVQRQGKELLEEVSGEETFESDKKLSALYRACMNNTRIEKDGNKPLLDLLYNLGGWPVLEGEKWSEESNTWYDITLKSSRWGAGIDYIMDVSVVVDAKNTMSRVIKLDQPSTGMSRENLVKGFGNKEVEAYYRFMVNVAKALEVNELTAETEMKEALEFEIELAKLSASKDERRDKTKSYKPTTVANFGSLYKQPPSLKEYLTKLFEDAGVVEVNLSDDEKIIVGDHSYLTNLPELLKKTNRKVVANYIVWRVVKSRMGFLPKEFRDIEAAFKRDLLGATGAAPDWRRCVTNVGFTSYDEGVTTAASSLYVRGYFSTDDKQKVEEIVKYSKNAFESMIKNNPWLGPCTKREAIRKLHSMGQTVGYPEELLDMHIMDEYHSVLDVSSFDHFANGLVVSKFKRGKGFEQLRQQVVRDDWRKFHYVTVLDAYYEYEENHMLLAAATLQGRNFNPHVPQALNFGNIGGAIGHEITHGFDNEGRQRNYQGNLVDWWKPETDAAFRKRAQCISDQYSKYFVQQVGLNLIGDNVQGESIADIGGLKAAYLAYNNWIKVNGQDLLLAGHDYAPKQLFWIGFAQSWCEKSKDGFVKERVLTGVHPPAYLRIFGSLTNNEDFARDFQCEKGKDRMNPAHKCTLW